MVAINELSGIKLPYGFKNQRLVHVSTVESGLSCNCICPYCKEKLIAKKGKIKNHHFAHANRIECEYGVQTAIHLVAKEILEKEKKISLPPIYKSIDLSHEDNLFFTDNERLIQGKEIYTNIIDKKFISFDKVYVENRFGSIVPDIILESKGKKLIIEIAVTHFVDLTKIRKIEKHNISAIEINLSSFKDDFSTEDIYEHVIEGTTFKKWIYNSKVPKLVEKKRQELIKKRTILKINDDSRKVSLKKERAQRAEFYKNYFKPVKKRYTRSRLRQRHIYPCYISRRFYYGEQFANLDLDCKECKYFRGLRDSQKYIVCLEKYYRDKGTITATNNG